MKTIAELRDEAARILSEQDDIVRTAEESGWTDDERARYDANDELLVGLHAEINRAQQAEGDNDRTARLEARRAAAVPTPMINLNRTSVRNDSQTLDDLLWATDDVVRAGSFDKTGQFRPHSTAVNPVEQVIVRAGGAGEGRLAPRITDFAGDHRGLIRTFQRTVADMALWGLLVDRGTRSSAQGFEAARSHPMFAEKWRNILRALDVDTAAEGGNWVPTGIGADLHEKVRAAGRVAALFARIDLPTNPWKWPLEGADATAYRVAEPTTDTETKVAASTPGTLAATFDAEIFGARTLVSRSLDADSALAILPYMRRKLVQAFVDAEEKAILDGDADGTHQDGDVSGTADARTAWDGLRKRALANASAATTTTSAANLGAIRALMGKWGINPADLAYIVGVSAMHDIILDSNVLTVDKMGPNATILNGQIGALYGIPIVVSEHVRENLNASGVYDAITTNKTYNLCVNRQEWVMGQRMALDIEVDDSIYRETFQRVLVGFQREDFQSVGETSGDDTAVGYNVTP